MPFFCRDTEKQQQQHYGRSHVRMGTYDFIVLMHWNMEIWCLDFCWSDSSFDMHHIVQIHQDGVIRCIEPMFQEWNDSVSLAYRLRTNSNGARQAIYYTISNNESKYKIHMKQNEQGYNNYYDYCCRISE